MRTLASRRAEFRAGVTVAGLVVVVVVVVVDVVIVVVVVVLVVVDTTRGLIPLSSTVVVGAS